MQATSLVSPRADGEDGTKARLTFPLQAFQSQSPYSSSNPNGSCDFPEKKTNPAIKKPRITRATRTNQTLL
jgi:hypothetical protein